MLRAENIHKGFAAPVLDGVDLTLREGEFCAIIGANGSGKSTLLRLLAGWLRPDRGQVTLDGRPLARVPARERARRIAALPQFPVAPDGLSAADLVLRGRFAYRRLIGGPSAADRAAVARAMATTGTADLAPREVQLLSGGQRQRVWLAMALAQDAGVLLLDEPTSALDLAHQVEVMRLLARLRDQGRTILAVLHDINLAARHADRLVVLAGGRVVADGPPAQVVTPAVMARAMSLDCVVLPDPLTGTPVVTPRP